MDKASVLGDAIKYLEYLQRRVKTLEEMNETTDQSVVAVRKSRIIVEDDEVSDNSNSLILPEIEARVYENNIRLKIQCEKRKGLLGKILGEIEKLDMAVVNIGVAPFGSLALDITIIAKMEKEFRLSTEDVAAALRSAIQAAAAAEET